MSSDTRNLIDLWARFEVEFLQPLSSRYNEDDERDLIQPLREAIYGSKVYKLCGFTVVEDSRAWYRVYFENVYVGPASSSKRVLAQVERYVETSPGVNISLAQFQEAWEGILRNEHP